MSMTEIKIWAEEILWTGLVVAASLFGIHSIQAALAGTGGL